MSTQSVLVYQGCCKKAPQIEWFKQQECIISQCWRLRAWDQGGRRATVPRQALGKCWFQSSPLSSSLACDSIRPVFTWSSP